MLSPLLPKKRMPRRLARVVFLLACVPLVALLSVFAQESANLNPESPAQSKPASQPVAPEQPPLTEVQDRLAMIQALEAVRALEEGVLTDIREGDVGAILGWGFMPWSGGPSRSGPRSGKWMENWKRVWSRWPVARRREGKSAGRCACWLTSWCNWGM